MTATRARDPAPFKAEPVLQALQMDMCSTRCVSETTTCPSSFIQSVRSHQIFPQRLCSGTESRARNFVQPHFAHADRTREHPTQTCSRDTTSLLHSSAHRRARARARAQDRQPRPFHQCTRPKHRSRTSTESRHASPLPPALALLPPWHPGPTPHPVAAHLSATQCRRRHRARASTGARERLRASHRC